MARGRLVKVVVSLAAVAVLGAAATIGGAKAVVAVQSSGRIVSAADAEPRDVAMVLGAAVWNGRPSPYLAGRLDVALALYNDAKAKVIIVSGTQDGGYSEPEAMRDYLVEHGVAPEHVVSDTLGDDTYTSCYRAKHVYGVDKLTVVTQNNHLPRAIAACEFVGIDAIGVGDDTRAEDARMQSYRNRELFANVKAVYDGLTKRVASTEGPSTAVADALATRR